MFLPDRDPHGPNRGLPQARAVEVVIVVSLFSCPTEEPPPGAGAGAAREQQLLPRARWRGGGEAPAADAREQQVLPRARRCGGGPGGRTRRGASLPFC
jgi:hypothetical protein